MDDTQHTARWDVHDDAEAQATMPEAHVELTAIEDQARGACERAARRYELAMSAFRALRDGHAAPSEQLELARLHAKAAQLAWFNTVVHYERMTARRRREV
jgi:hypothetical protein